MAETSAMKSDCAETHSAFACDLTCILIIVCVLCSVVIIIVIVAVIRRKKDLKQDTINAVFNDTNDDRSYKSSHIGVNNVAMKRAPDSEYPDGHQQSELPGTGDVDGALNDTDYENLNGFHVHTPDASTGVRNRTQVEGVDRSASMTAKL